MAAHMQGNAAQPATESSAGAGERSILDRPVPKRGETSESAFLFLFSEMVQYCQSHARTPDEFKDKLSGIGRSIGVRYAELLAYRSTRAQRFTDMIDVLKYISSTVWKALFGKEADGLEKATGSKGTCLPHFTSTHAQARARQT